MGVEKNKVFESVIMNFDQERKYGFIEYKETNNLFFHMENVKNPKEIVKGAKVRFEIYENPKPKKQNQRFSAINVEVITDETHKEAKIQKNEFKTFDQFTKELQETQKVNGETKKEHITKNKHTNVKAAGVKSVFAVDDGNVLITSFGRGNAADIETLKSDDDKTINLTETENQKKYVVTNKRSNVKGLADNPTKVESIIPGETQIGFKSILEKHFFGRTFNDNIHIQIIHNILDIKKILAVHTNNIVYALDNIHERGRENSAEKPIDMIGAGGISTSKEYEQYCSEKSDYEDNFLKQLINNERIAYFGNAFFKDEGNKKVMRTEKEIYYILGMLNEVRNVSTHFTEEDNRDWAKANLYNLSNRLKVGSKEVLNQLYKEKIDKIDANGFVNKGCKRDFSILFKSLNLTTDKDKGELVVGFYDFSIRKNYKNIGFSIKTLREYMLKISNSTLCADTISNNAIRPKAYKLYDFIIWHYYMNKPDKINDFVEKLRTQNKNDEKIKLYYDEAVCLLSELGREIHTMTSCVHNIENTSYEITDKKQKEYYKMQINSLNSADKVSDFSKVIYLVTLFLDGKEINDLLTTLINKFDNIASLLSVLEKQSGKKVEFVENYSFFNSSNLLKEKTLNKSENYTCKIVEELREINSFARMTGDCKIRKSAFEDASQLLGYHDKTVNNLFEVLRLKELESKDWKKRTDDEQQEYDRLLNKHHYFKSGKKLPDTGLRNFIINNVIESRRFNYIVRYADPKKIRKCTENNELLKFAFKDVPDSQVDRYYNICVTNKITNATREEKIERLVDIIKSMNLSKVATVKQRDKQDNVEKQKQLAIMSLYLNILYQIAKNLVYVNSRYVMAFHSLERDSQMLFDAYYDVKRGYCDLSTVLLFGVDDLQNRNRGSYKYLRDNRRSNKDVIETFGDFKGKVSKVVEKKNQGLTNEIYDSLCNVAGTTKTEVQNEIKSILKSNGLDESASSYLSHKLVNKVHSYKYLKQNLDCADNTMINQFRNNVAHLNTIRNMDGIENVTGITSYFQIYHYLMQKALYKEFKKCRENAVRKWIPYITENAEPKYVYWNKKEQQEVEVSFNPKIFGYMENIKNHSNTYCKDFVKALCAPFAYNLPRFKNLSIEELFDMHELSEEPKESMKLTD
ncbi:MAG: hypothetical protein E7522_09525 [Ruminococcaceae bacterium]|nr:hypothetical protein [Oscillospiraceae bacterium]